MKITDTHFETCYAQTVDSKGRTSTYMLQRQSHTRITQKSTDNERSYEKHILNSRKHVLCLPRIWPESNFKLHIQINGEFA